jgi:ubiquinone/menaquinone biosynthesis C-methylase UbiE
MKKNLLLVLFVSLIGLTCTTVNPKYSDKVYGNVADFFENENAFCNFFDFHTGDIVAEVGAGYGRNIRGFSIVTDSNTFYIQDIDTNVLSQKNFIKIVKHCKKLKKPLTNKYYKCIGTEKQTNLPDNTFDKIILVAAFHEFTYKNEMMTDIYKKLKPTGQLYILEANCLSHKNYSADEIIGIIKKYNFSLVKKDVKVIKNCSGLYRIVFKKY